MTTVNEIIALRDHIAGSEPRRDPEHVARELDRLMLYSLRLDVCVDGKEILPWAPAMVYVLSHAGSVYPIEHQRDAVGARANGTADLRFLSAHERLEAHRLREEKSG